MEKEMIILRKQVIEEREFAKPGTWANFIRKGKRDAGYALTNKKACMEIIPLGPKDKERIEAISRLGRITNKRRIQRLSADLRPAFA